MSLDRLCRRFEIAVGNFGRSCIAMRANERAFQAWYAAAVIQEFGMSRVYREVHFDKPALFKMVKHDFFTSCLKLYKGHELFPDLSVSWEPDVDARHSSTRPTFKDPGEMLRQFGILSELKVTGSTGAPTPVGHIRRDLVKLGVFAAAHKITESASEGALKTGIATYMVVLDNFCDDCGAARPHYEEDRMDYMMEVATTTWPIGVAKPVVLLLCPEGSTAVMKTYRDFSATDIPLEILELEAGSTPQPATAAVKCAGATKRPTKMSPDDYYRKLSAKEGESISEQVKSVIQEAAAHGLEVVWRASGPVFHYTDPRSLTPFSFGFSDPRYATWLSGQCADVGLPPQIGEGFLHEIERLLWGTGDEQHSVALFVSRKDEWFAAVDRAVTRIRQGMEEHATMTA